MTRNLLDRETSPYLLQHRDNPVHWRPWGPEALAEAREHDKPILLSVGYAACHWCHVMAHESFEDPAIAQVMNDLFVNVKVDREERPDLDTIYQSALALMGEHGGWPLTMFLTPAGEPFWGGTYFPPTARFGRPAFPDLLHTIADVYAHQRDKVTQNAQALCAGLENLSRPEGGGALDTAALDQAGATALRMVDPVRGGTNGAPKFPQVPFLRFLWRGHRRTGSDLYRDAVTMTLDRMCQGGIYDHLAGGFARYSTDEKWLVPHFEKMLYDNAQIVDLLTEAWQETQSPLYAARVAETLDWCLRDMAVTPDDGSAREGPLAFASAFDADSEGVEGKYYVWTEDEIDAVLGAAAPVFKETYGVTAQGNWEGVTVLNRPDSRALGSDVLETELAHSRARLLAVRDGRVPPQRDDKVLADWNGLMVQALAKAGAVFGRPDWVDAARRVIDFVTTHMTVDGRLHHAWRAGRARHGAVLEDLANLAAGAVTLFEVTGEAAYLDRARAWVAQADAHHWDPVGGGYFMPADTADDVITRSKTVHDNAVPSGNGTLAEVQARLYLLTGETAHRDRVEDLASVFAVADPRRLVSMPSLLNGWSLLAGGLQVVVAGDPAADDTRALLAAALAGGLNDAVVGRVAPGDDLPEDHPARGKGPIDGRAAAYVCRGATCG
ncbi:MAG: thioredoxin domain-containing protein, partial [Rhodobacterales bacterium]|nr:thioredoxin domain-containing protein [Rhodobacterales bacterium]